MFKTMFENLFDLSVKKTALQAVTFYFVFMLLGLIVGLIIIIAVCVLYCVCNSDVCLSNGEAFGRRLGTLTGLIFVFFYCLGLNVLILSVKRMWSNLLALLLFIISIPLSIIGGSFLALIPIAVLTTLDSNRKERTAISNSEQEENKDNKN